MEMAMKGILAVFWLILVPVAVGRLPFVKRRQPLLTERFRERLSDPFFDHGGSDPSNDVSENAAACAGDFLWNYRTDPGSDRCFCDGERRRYYSSVRYF